MAEIPPNNGSSDSSIVSLNNPKGVSGGTLLWMLTRDRMPAAIPMIVLLRIGGVNRPRAIDEFIEAIGDTKPDKIVGIDARGFIFGALIAARLNAGFIPVRKKGKLPWQTRGIDYALEYGTNSVEMHLDAISPGETVLLADDLLATGGTAGAALHLIEQAGGNVLGSTFFIELGFLGGREKVANSG
ncbi:MAG: adenine phosphoribosyltransferase, partial [Microgenomates group bacterium]